MKRLLLSVSLLTMSLGTVFAQTHSALSGNAPTADGKGYTFNFNGSAANNCLGGGGVGNNGGVLNQTWSISGGQLVVTVPTMTSYDDTRQVLKFYGGDCVGSTIDLSSAANQKLSFKVNSSPASTSTTTSRELVIIFYNSDGTQTNYSNHP
ncbi:MAG: hypothetical protein K2Q22_04925, partial [Cytophagales bacterium]|nr:hypothetical protein [Cytophagales bacterium]